MNLYELITPSDPITFKAEDDKVAFYEIENPNQV